MKVHFGGSSKGFREYTNLYKLINETIKDLGHSISNEWVYNTETDQDTFTSKFDGTLSGILKADALVLEKTVPSMEVGQQYHIGTERNLPILFLNYDEQTKKNSVESVENQENMNYLVDPSKTSLIYTATYNASNIKQLLKIFFTVVCERYKTARFNLVLERYLDNYLRDLALKHKTSKSEEIRRLILDSMNNSSH